MDLPSCTIGTETNPNLPVCRDSGSVAENHDYFKLIDDAIPTNMTVTNKDDQQVLKNLNFCVDATSAILRSGVHYGDQSETNNEWKRPVTIIGSHDCKLMFFEPMISWKWISNGISDKENPWPKYNVTNIKYKNKRYEPLPTGWVLEVSDPGCTRNPSRRRRETTGSCKLTLTVEGNRCTNAQNNV